MLQDGLGNAARCSSNPFVHRPPAQLQPLPDCWSPLPVRHLCTYGVCALATASSTAPCSTSLLVLRAGRTSAGNICLPWPAVWHRLHALRTGAQALSSLFCEAPTLQSVESLAHSIDRSTSVRRPVKISRSISVGWSQTVGPHRSLDPHRSVGRSVKFGRSKFVIHIGLSSRSINQFGQPVGRHRSGGRPQVDW